MTVDFIAEIRYLTSEEGGRNMPTRSGYRPQLKFDFAEMQTSGNQTFLDKDVVYPGETVMAEIKILSVDYFAYKLTENMKFDFREGSKIIGTGVIKKIINEKLLKVDF
jgi:translation elongation factor EF-Tu-like GTPase